VKSGLALVLLSLLTYFLFPGHTYLTQDSQIYVPILEHLWDPSVLTRDILVQRPHVAFTIYDELALSLRWLTHLGFHEILAGQQILFRALGLWGIYLISLTVLNERRLALLATAVFALGAEVPGPAVLLMEYEPTPRAFAVPLLFLAVGLVARRHYMWASVAASVAFLLHPPTVYPFWILYFAVTKSRRGVLPLLCAVVLLFAAAHWQSGIKESQQFFSRIPIELETLQRMRAPYNWVSTWWRDQLAEYIFLTAVAGLALWRLRDRIPTELRLYLTGLPVIGLLSVPVSYVLLDHLKWGLMPQLQPARALLFVVAVAILAAALAACNALRNRRWPEAIAWFAIAFLTTMRDRIDTIPPLPHVAIALALAALFTIPMSGRLATCSRLVIGFLAIPYLAQVHNYADLNTPQLRELSAWAHNSTPRESVFLFPSPPKNLAPGIFRSESLRAIYVDWKGGGQVNYLKDFAEEWWQRYQQTILRPFNEPDLPRYAALGIDYIVLPPNRTLTRAPIFTNPTYAVYSTH
jgi:hypothetical protein